MKGPAVNLWTMNLTVDLFLFTFGFINTFMHSTGVCLLIYFYRTGKKDSQKVYFINLSIAEVLLNFMEILTGIPEMISHSKELSIGFRYIQYYANLFNMTTVWVVLYLTMVYITADRLLTVRYGLKYKMYWRKKKANYLIITTWVACLTTSLIISITGFFIDFHYQDIFYKYIFPTIDFGYIILTVSTYSYIFHRHQKSYKMKNKFSRRRSRRRVRKITTSEAFRDSRFCTTILLVLTFIVFIIIPDLVYLFFGMEKAHFSHNSKPAADLKSDILFDYCRVSYVIASTMDFFIYIFIQPAVKEILCKKCFHVRSVIYNTKKNSDVSCGPPIEFSRASRPSTGVIEKPTDRLLEKERKPHQMNVYQTL